MVCRVAREQANATVCCMRYYLVGQLSAQSALLFTRANESGMRNEHEASSMFSVKLMP